MRRFAPRFHRFALPLSVRRASQNRRGLGLCCGSAASSQRDQAGDIYRGGKKGGPRPEAEK